MYSKAPSTTSTPGSDRRPGRVRRHRSGCGCGGCAAADQGDGELGGSAAGLTGTLRIQDRTSLAAKANRKGVRDPKTVYALVLHQMAFSRGNDPKRYDAVASHYTILPDGQITQLHPVSALVWTSNGFNPRSVAVEFAGNFPNVKGACWSPATNASSMDSLAS